MMNEFAVHQCIYAALSAATPLNQYIEEHKPWALTKDSNESDRLQAVLYYTADSLRISAILLSPVLPKAAHGIFDQLNWKTELSGKEERFSLADAEWGVLPDGHVVGKPVPLFPRIEG
jgi:methionyl-tRNA synthetase